MTDEISTSVAKIEASIASNNNTPRQHLPPDPKGHFWTHGYRVNHTHTSKSWNYMAKGHKDESTRSNPMGGRELNKSWMPSTWRGGNDKIVNYINNITTTPILSNAHPTSHHHTDDTTTAIEDMGASGMYLIPGAHFYPRIKLDQTSMWDYPMVLLSNLPTNVCLMSQPYRMPHA